MKHPKYLYTLSLLLSVSFCFAQKGILKQANKYFKAEKYHEALDLYNKVEKLNEDKNLLFNRGIANYFTNNIDDAIRDFSISKRIGFDKDEIYLFTAKALHARGSYKDAAQFYKNYLRFARNEEEQFKIIEYIKQCKFAYNNSFNDQVAFVENLGTGVNTMYDEIHPVQSPTTQNKYYFSSNRAGSNGGLRNKKGFKDEIYGKYSSDMYAVELNNGNWTAVSAFHPILNSPKDDIIQGFNPDGSVLYYLKSLKSNSGYIYADTFSVDKDPETFPKLLKSPIICELGDKDIHVFNDNTILFSSKRVGGYGGYDLYITQKLGNKWSIPENLGPRINTNYDETAPFLTKSGAKLFFSSDRIEGFGGTDIFEVSYNHSSKDWSEVKNIGIPINSPRDDNHFSISADGMTAVFSSDRAGSIGGTDLYLAYYKDQVVDQLMYTEEVPFMQVGDSINTNNQVATESTTDEVQEEKVERKEFFIQPMYYGSDEIIITPSNRSKLNQIRDLMIVYPEIAVVLTGHSIQEGMREFDLYFSVKRSEKAAEYLIEKGVKPSRIKVRGLGSNYPHTKNTMGGFRLAEKNNRRIDVSFVKVPTNRLSVVYERPTVAEAFLDGSSDDYYTVLEGLSYKIEVAKTKQMYKADIIRQYASGTVEKDYTAPEYTYTIGLFDTYSEAKQLKSKLLRLGVIDAEILAYMNDILLTKEQIEVLKDVYPDLLDYLQFEKD